MEEKKTLVINSGLCDTRQVREETLAGYEKIVLNCGEVVVSPESRALLNRYPVTMNAGSVLELEEGVELVRRKGKVTLAPGQAPRGKKVFLSVQGTLEVAPGSEETLAAYAGIRVRGNILCPESMTGAVAGVELRGSLDTYPDGCTLLKPTTVLDGTFSLRAREGARYFISRRAVAVDPALDTAALSARGVGFVTREVLVAQSMAGAVLPLFNEEAEVTVLPDGCVFWQDDVTLDRAFLDRWGGSLYVLGDVTVGEDAPLDRMSFLHVEGDVTCPKQLAEALNAIPRLEYSELFLTVGQVISDRPRVRVDRAMLEGAEGVSIRDCARVEISPDIPAELLREKLLSLQDCAEVRCDPRQRWAVELAARDVARIMDGEEPEEAGEASDRSRTMVNTGEYKL